MACSSARGPVGRHGLPGPAGPSGRDRSHRRRDRADPGVRERRRHPDRRRESGAPLHRARAACSPPSAPTWGCWFGPPNSLPPSSGTSHSGGIREGIGAPSPLQARRHLADPAARLAAKESSCRNSPPTYRCFTTSSPFLDRFEAAAEAGFTGVEYLFPYAYPKEQVVEKLRPAGLTQVLHNLPAGDWAKGERGHRLPSRPRRRVPGRRRQGDRLRQRSGLQAGQLSRRHRACRAWTADKVRRTFVDNLQVRGGQAQGRRDRAADRADQHAATFPASS